MRKTALLWIASLVGTALLASGLTYAQIPQIPRPDAAILSGSDLGFLIDGYTRDGKPQGKLVVRQNGAWVDVGFSIAVRPVR